MESKSPLHNRQTATLEIKPFNYYESATFFKEYSNVDKLIAYGILSDIPRYLEAFPKLDIQLILLKKVLICMEKQTIF